MTTKQLITLLSKLPQDETAYIAIPRRGGYTLHAIGSAETKAMGNYIVPSEP